MNFGILVLPEAEDDLVDIYHYVANHDLSGQTDKLLDSLELKCTSLISDPEWGME